ncbi:probable G-protein coupled receptor 139 [Lingula anatina]|uniref:Probable G-protein coupled receptor 139 n=1 Tax=Lingula anatina TaxID=7574 RepID=A0A1S3H804_LINAN|nr:probable G-protein coupled receptor 139 [Lingula anatina]|eukprot:XP_013381254.1 probable G-protein coupled receptor 139 [Lingula anatina]
MSNETVVAYTNHSNVRFMSSAGGCDAPSSLDVQFLCLAFLAEYHSILVMAPLGMVCNILALVTFLASRLRDTSTSCYLVGLAVCDSVVLLGDMLEVLVTAQGWTESCFFWLPLWYLSAVGRCMSAWIIVTFTIERFVSVAFPLKRQSICTAKRAKQMIVVLLLFSLASNAYFFVLFDYIPSVSNPNSYRCNVKPAMIEEYLVCSIVFKIGMSIILPIVIVVVFNTVTIRILDVVKRKRRQMSSKKNDSSDEQSLIDKTTAMLLVTSTCYVVLAIPYVVTWIVTYFYQYIEGAPDRAQSRTYSGIKKITHIFYVMNFAINFFLYCISGTVFRSELSFVFRNRTCQRQRSMSPTGVSSNTIVNRRNLHASDRSAAAAMQMGTYHKKTDTTEGSQRPSVEISSKDGHCVGSSNSSICASSSSGPNGNVVESKL